MPHQPQAVGYIRVSTNEQSMNGLSLDAQRRKIRAQAEISDLHLVDVLEDPGHSAATLNRPAMTELLDRIERGQLDVIVITKLDRLTRSVKDLSLLLERLEKSRRADGGKGIDIVSTAESLDTSTATGRMVIGILGVIAQWERDIISERTVQALAEVRAQGRFTGRPRYGYTADEKGNVRQNEHEQAVLARIAQLRQDGLGWSRLAEMLAAEGIRTRRGTPFSRQGLHQMAKRAGMR